MGTSQLALHFRIKDRLITWLFYCPWLAWGNLNLRGCPRQIWMFHTWMLACHKPVKKKPEPKRQKLNISSRLHQSCSICDSWRTQILEFRVKIVCHELRETSTIQRGLKFLGCGNNWWKAKHRRRREQLSRNCRIHRCERRRRHV